MSVAAASYSQHSTSRGTEARRSHYPIGPISTGPQRRSRSFRSSRRRRTGRLPTYDRVARRCGAAAEPRRARGADARDDAARAARPPHQDSFATRILSRGVPKLAGVPPPGGLATHRSLTMRCAIRLFMLVCPASACKTGGRSDGMREGLRASSIAPAPGRDGCTASRPSAAPAGFLFTHPDRSAEASS
jgi:hypothetical protein